MKILIADDSLADQLLLSTLVKELEHDVLIAENGHDAVTAVEKQHPDLVLMDIIMPVEDGLSATARIRALELDYWLPIILLSALDQPQNIIKGIEAGADDYLTRPIHPKIIQAKIQAMARIKELQSSYKKAVDTKKKHLSQLHQQGHLHSQLRRAMDEAVIVVETDLEGAITSVNKNFCEISGYKSDELLGQNHRILHSGMHNRAFFKDLWKTITQGRVWTGDVCNKAKNGDLFWLRTTIVPYIDDKTGNIINYKTIRFDITEQKNLEAKLRIEKQRAEITLASIADGIIKADKTGNIQFMNRAAEALTGWSFNEIKNDKLETIFNLVDKNTKAKHSDLLSISVLDESKFLPENTILISRHNEEFNIDGSITPTFEEGELEGCVVVFQNTTDKHRLETEVEWQAWHDALTSLPNRTLLKERFNISIANANRTKTMLAVCILDLDDFKQINDSYGQGKGDQILVRVADRLTEITRDDDTAARLGGDEFVLLLNGFNSLDEVDLAIQRIYEKLSLPIKLEDQTFHLSHSIGISTYPTDNVDADTLLRHADQAMYQAKRLGRRRFTYFDQESELLSQNRINQINLIRKAVFNNEMVLFFQPKVNMLTHAILGAEALIRWQHPKRGLLSPAEFLPVIEATDVDIALGEWVIEQALCQLEDWKGTDWTISINISGYHFTHTNFRQQLKDALARHPLIDSQNLELEILETTALDDIDQVSNLICECQALGVKFALDDFGTGYSSLAYLKQLPANWLKIDQTFVRDMLDDRSDMALVEGIISLSRVFQREVIAEGVETPEHGVLLLRLGCQYAQGYGIARPMPANEMTPWAKNYHPHPLWEIWSTTEWELSDLPLLVAQHDHTQWIETVLNTFDTGILNLSEKELSNHFECRLGNWYYGHGKKHYGHLNSFQELEKMHVDFHHQGHEVIKLLKAGQAPKARLIAEHLLTLKHQIIDKLFELQKQVHSAKPQEEQIQIKY
jgi:diguanylate cyclase (GGDEF)-like protein/PAS domain S-box-containing protein